MKYIYKILRYPYFKIILYRILPKIRYVRDFTNGNKFLFIW